MVFLFYFIFIFIIASALMVILSRNPIHSVLWLVMSFFGGAALMLLLETEFMAMLFIVVYMGAIAVLFLFVVMMINIKIIQIKEELITYLPLSFITFIIFFMEIWLCIKIGKTEKLEGEYALANKYGFDWLSSTFNVSNIKMIGNVIYTYNFYPFILSSLILLIAMVGSIVLTLNKNKVTKKQDVYKQLKKKADKSIVIKKYKKPKK